MSYWRTCAVRAWNEAAQSVGLNTGERVAVALLIQAAIACGLFIWAINPQSTLLVRVLTVAAPFALFPFLFFWKWTSLAPTLAKEKADLERRLTPVFRLYFDPEVGVAHPTEEYPQAGQGIEPNSTYVRVHFACVTDAPVQGCKLFLTKLEKARHGGSFEDQRLPHAIDMWTGHRVDVLPTIGAKVDLLRVNKADNLLTPPPWVEWPNHMRAVFAEASIYRLTLSAVCDLHRAQLVLDVDWRGSWDTLTAREGGAG